MNVWKCRSANGWEPLGDEEVYDLVADPDEITNMAYQPTQQERLKALQEKLKT
mgnify:CR=1 FL=1